MYIFAVAFRVVWWYNIFDNVCTMLVQSNIRSFKTTPLACITESSSVDEDFLGLDYSFRVIKDEDMNKHCVVGYHGTTQARAEHILSGELFRESNKKTEWLGTGVYFFMYLMHAQWWTTHDRFADEETVVLKANLEYTDEEMLDLDDPAQREKVEKCVKQFILMTADTIKPTKPMSEKESWCVACNLFRRFHNKIGIIKYTFPQKRRYEYSRFWDNQCQLCVSKSSIIKKVEEV